MVRAPVVPARKEHSNCVGRPGRGGLDRVLLRGGGHPWVVQGGAVVSPGAGS